MSSKSGPHCWRREVSAEFAQQFVTAVIAPPLVGYVVWVDNSMSSSQLCKVGPRLFSCFTSTSSMPVAFPFFVHGECDVVYL